MAVDSADIGIIEQGIMAWLTGLKPETLKFVATATSEEAADEMTKQYPAAILVWDGTSVTDEHSTQSSQFSEDARTVWSCFLYTLSGRPDQVARYGDDGMFTVERKVRERLIGKAPPGQVSGAWPLLWLGSAPSEPFEGTSELKVKQQWALDNQFRAVAG